jgi:hypothetical protein
MVSWPKNGSHGLDEIPVSSNIEFAEPWVKQKMELMLKEMICRDQTGAGVII